jgi:dTDP-4-amino-4,6-dideoxygalactose transaminase
MYNCYQIVDEFERTIAAWSGSKYAVAVESCTAALFLACLRHKVTDVEIPKFTYPGVPCSIINAGGKVKFRDDDWSGVYELKPYKIYDGALRFKKGMYEGGTHCLSFHMKKHLPIGRGGMILTDSKDDYIWYKRMRFDGRREVSLEEDTFDMIGYNMYLTPEQAVRGLQLFSTISQRGKEDLVTSAQGYPDLSRCPVYREGK